MGISLCPRSITTEIGKAVWSVCGSHDTGCSATMPSGFVTAMNYDHDETAGRMSFVSDLQENLSVCVA